MAEVVVTSDGERLAVEMAGPAAGASVLLCHALVGGRGTWDGVAAELLGRGCQVVTFDQRGHRESSGPGAVTMDRLADDVEEIVSQLALGEVALVGHSSGGYALLAIHRKFLAEHARSGFAPFQSRSRRSLGAETASRYPSKLERSLREQLTGASSKSLVLVT